MKMRYLFISQAKDMQLIGNSYFKLLKRFLMVSESVQNFSFKKIMLLVHINPA